MGKLQLIHFSYIPNSLFQNVHKIVSQQAHALLPFVFFGAKSRLFSGDYRGDFTVMFGCRSYEKRGEP